MQLSKKRINLSKYVDNVCFHDIFFIIIILISWIEGQFSSSPNHQVKYHVVFFFAFFSKIYVYIGSIVYIVLLRWLWTLIIEAATGRVLWKKVFLQILQNSQENEWINMKREWIKRESICQNMLTTSLSMTLFIIIILISWTEGQFSSSRDHQVEYVSFFFAFFSKMYSYLGSIVYIVFLRWLWTLIIKGATRVVRLKKVFLEILQNSQEITCARVSLLIKLQVWGLQLY